MRARRGRERRESGFTLIELLVVVVILGVISGVVVFAVRGSGDKGRQAAVETDRRIVRTAMEAFCARYGRYAQDMDELVNGPRDLNNPRGRLGKGFLSEASTYNADFQLTTGGPNQCGGTSYQFTGGETAKCFQLNNDGDEEEITVTSELKDSGFWCLAAEPGRIVEPDRPSVNQMMQLPNGKVLTMTDEVTALEPELLLGLESTTGLRTVLFDPADGDRGAWHDGPTARLVGGAPRGTLSDMVVLGSRPGHPEDCGDHCGKVLGHFVSVFSSSSRPDVGHWALYDPKDGDEAEWKATERPAAFPRALDTGPARAVQLLGTGCAAHCGKVLIVGLRPTIAELYNPRTEEFELSGDYGDLGECQTGAGQPCLYNYPTLSPLTDGSGRVLVYFQHNSAPSNVRLFDPNKGIKGEFSPIPAPPRKYFYDHRPQVLSDGGVLFLDPGTLGDIYRPGPVGQGGTWEAVGACGDASSSCGIIASLADGRILVRRRPASLAGYKGETRLFTYKGSGNGAWSDTGSLNRAEPWGPALLLTGDRCGLHCGKVLTARNKRAELYTPPPRPSS